MELTAKRSVSRTIKRIPCKENNFDFTQKSNTKRNAKPGDKNLSIQVSFKNSAENSASISPPGLGVPLSFVTPSNVNISYALQEKIRSRSKSKNSEKTRKPSFLKRTEDWKEETNNKILKLLQEKDKNEMSECTFAPNIKKPALRSRINSKRSSGYRDMSLSRRGSVKEDLVELRKIEDSRDLEIEKSYQRITMALDSISKQILDAIGGERVN